MIFRGSKNQGAPSPVLAWTLLIRRIKEAQVETSHGLWVDPQQEEVRTQTENHLAPFCGFCEWALERSINCSPLWGNLITSEQKLNPDWNITWSPFCEANLLLLSKTRIPRLKYHLVPSLWGNPAATERKLEPRLSHHHLAENPKHFPP